MFLPVTTKKLKKDFFWRYLEKFGKLYVVFMGLSFVTNKTRFIFARHARKLRAEDLFLVCLWAHSFCWSFQSFEMTIGANKTQNYLNLSVEDLNLVCCSRIAVGNFNLVCWPWKRSQIIQNCGSWSQDWKNVQIVVVLHVEISEKAIRGDQIN